MSRNNTHKSVSSFLHFGYVPRVLDDVDKQPWAMEGGLSSPLKGVGESALVSEGLKALESTFHNPGNGLHVVPLSGGLDSRAILAGLIRAGLREQIIAVTFGVPGNWDFDIGSLVATEAGVRHEAIDLNNIKLTQEVMEQTARRFDSWIWLFDAVYNGMVTHLFGKEATYWIGYFGDPLAGSHLPQKDSNNWIQARDGFVRRGQFSRNLKVTHPDFEAEESLPDTPILNCSRLTYDEQLDFVLRQHSYIRPLVVPKEHRCRIPFVDKIWVDFMLGVPRKFREQQCLYKEILKRINPKLFSLPTKNQLGLSLFVPSWLPPLKKLCFFPLSFGRRHLPSLSWPPDPTNNYIDFENSLRKRGDIKELVRNNLMSLRERGIVDWINLEMLWEHHQKGKGNFANAITLLISLEINLKVEQNSEGL